VLLPTAEVVRVLEDPAGLTGTGRERGVQLRMPSDRAPAVAAAIATARIFVVKAPGPARDQAAPAPPAPSGPPGPPDTSPPDSPQSGTTQPDEYPLDTAPSDTSPNASQAEVKAVIR
jgi:hypothetical protein